MGKRGRIAVGMALGALWAVGLLYVGGTQIKVPIFALTPTILTAFLAPGLVLMLVIARLAQRRFFDDAIIDGQDLAPGTGAQIDQRVLANTVEQLVLVLAIWPAAALMLGERGPGVILSLGLGFAVARLAFWIGYHIAPPLRAFGFAATFYPTVLVAVWALVTLAGLGAGTG